MSKKMFFNNLNKTPVVSFIPAQIGKINTIIDSGQGLYMVAGGNQVAILSDLNNQYASVTTTITNVTDLNFTAGVWFNNSFCVISRNGWFFRFDTSCNEINRVSFGTELLNDILVNNNELLLLRNVSVTTMAKFHKSTDGIVFSIQSLTGLTRFLGYVFSKMQNGNILLSGNQSYSQNIIEIDSNYSFVATAGISFSVSFQHNNGNLTNPVATSIYNGYGYQWFTKFNGAWVSGQNTIFNFNSLVNCTAKFKIDKVLFFANNGTWIANENYTTFENLDTTAIPYLDMYTNKRAVNTNNATFVANNQTIIKVS